MTNHNHGLYCLPILTSAILIHRTATKIGRVIAFGCPPSTFLSLGHFVFIKFHPTEITVGLTETVTFV